MQISLSIKKAIYRDYLKSIFEMRNGGHLLSRDHDFGKFVISRIRYSRLPVKQIVDHTTVVFTLPAGRSLANADKHYLYLLKEDEAKINEQLDAIFNIDFDRYCLAGLKMNMMYKDIVQAFILNRKIVSLIGDNETLKKREYREQLSLMKKYAEQLYQKAYHRNSHIENELDACKLLIAI